MAGEIDPKAAAELAENIKLAGKYAAESLDPFQKQLKIITQMRDAMEEVAKIMYALCQQDCKALNPEVWKNVTKEVLKNKDANESLVVSQKKVMTTAAKLAKGILIAGVAFSALKQGMENITAIGKGVFNVFLSLADGLWEVTKSIIAVPFKLMEGLFTMANSGGGDSSYAQALENIRKQYGSLKSDASMAIKSAAQGLKTLDLGGISTYRIFGNVAERLEAITKMAQGMGATFQVFRNEVKENGAAIAAYNKGLGITDEMMSGIAYNAIRMGKGIASVQNDMTKQSLGMSKAFSVNAKVISNDMGKAMQDLAHFGHLSTKELAIAATFANKLGVSVDKLTGIMDATATFDQAAEGMSKLNEQYHTNIDATEIMMAQSGAEKLEIIRKEFAKTGKDMSKLTYQDNMFIKAQTNMSEELIFTAFAAKNANVSLSDIEKQGSKNEKKTLTQAEAMSKLANSMERIVQSGQSEGGIFDHFMQGMTRGLKSAPEFIALMHNIREIFRIAIMSGFEFGQMLTNLFPGIKDIFGGLEKIFNPERWKTMFSEVKDAFKVFSIGGSQSIDEFINKIKVAFNKFFAGGEAGSTQVIEGFKKLGKVIFAILLEVANWTWEKLKNLYDDVTLELTNPGPTTKKVIAFFSDIVVTVSKFLREKAIPFARDGIMMLTSWLTGDKGALSKSIPAAGALMSTMGVIFDPLGEALKEAFVKLTPVILDLVVKLWIGLKIALIDAAWKAFKELDWKSELAMAFVTFGPSISGLLVSGIMTFFAKKALEKTLISALEGAVQGSLVQAAAGTGTQAAVGGFWSKFSGMIIGGARAAAGYIVTGLEAIGSVVTAGAAAVIAAVLVIGGTIWYAASTALATEEEKAMHAADRGKFIDQMNAIEMSNVDKIKIAAEKRDTLLKEAEDKRGTGFINWLRGTKGENEQILRANADEAGRFEAQLRRQANEERTVGTKAYEAKMAKDAEKRQLETLGPVTIQNAAERFKKVEELASLVMDKGFNIKDKLDAIRTKMGNVNWNIFDSGEKEEQVNKSFLAMQKVQGIFASLADVAGLISVAIDRLSYHTDKKIIATFTQLKTTIGLAIESITQKDMEGINFTAPIIKINDLVKNLETISISFTNIKKAPTDIKEKINSIFTAVLSMKTDFSTDGIDTFLEKIPKIEQMLTSINKISTSIADFILSSSKYTEISVNTASFKTIATVAAMVKTVQNMDDALSKLDKINITTRLESLSKSLGIGSSGIYTVQGKDVIINVSFNITMDAGKVEKAILMNKESTIRDRINFALGAGTGQNKTVPGSISSSGATTANFAGSVA